MMSDHHSSETGLLVSILSRADSAAIRFLVGGPVDKFLPFELVKRLAEALFAATTTVGVLRMESPDNSRVSRSIHTCSDLKRALRLWATEHSLQAHGRTAAPREEKLAIGGGPLDELQRLTVCSADPTTDREPDISVISTGTIWLCSPQSITTGLCVLNKNKAILHSERADYQTRWRLLNGQGRTDANGRSMSNSARYCREWRERRRQERLASQLDAKISPADCAVVKSSPPARMSTSGLKSTFWIASVKAESNFFPCSRKMRSRASKT
jgi:hypothetical protein